MDATPLSDHTESSDQELVDVYATHAPVDLVSETTAKQIRRASEAAHVLELRGYTEQAGIWLHEERPALSATA
jgi:hypothetical protein